MCGLFYIKGDILFHVGLDTHTSQIETRIKKADVYLPNHVCSTCVSVCRVTGLYIQSYTKIMCRPLGVFLQREREFSDIFFT